ncbi:hypothetical protein GN958_ATG23592 [Phytophthora infestans]|uniref:Uncharacterized protein n=1 Tax=Phytophthora infestans TaxID=4787 RepID=A0A8S9TMM4_PHYIN|nr:hypothetical protein GN958_ATG23592 [Phytophthora infestans]
MVGLRQENNFAKLRKHTGLLPVKRNVTHWSSTFTMIPRYIRIRSEIKKVETVEELIQTSAKHRKIFDLIKQRKKFESSCLRLQRDGTYMAEIQVMVDALIAEFPVLEGYSYDCAATCI